MSSSTTDDVIYNEIGRFYKIDGCYFPSVTTVLSHSKKEFFKEWAEKIGEEKRDQILKYASERGTEVHAMCEEYLKSGKVVIKNQYYYFLFLKIKRWLDNNIRSVTLQEELLFSKKMKVAGRVDLIADTHEGLQIIDFKTSTKMKQEEWIESYFMQCAAYAYCYYEMTGILITKFTVVITEETSNSINVFTKNTMDYIKKFIQLRKDFKECYDM